MLNANAIRDLYYVTQFDIEYPTSDTKMCSVYDKRAIYCLIGLNLHIIPFPISVRQVIPIIRGNDTVPTGSGTVTLAGKKKKRDVSHADQLAQIFNDELDYDKYRRPNFVRRTDR